ncbi:MAG: hypothetical protein QOG67_3336 [Verrucomicrobiota bacterium]|jgi:hypothetical protein
MKHSAITALLSRRLIIVWFAKAVVATAQPDRTITQEELVRRTQELCDAVASGDKGPWQKYFAEDATYSDEKGRTLDKLALVADITPLPKGYSGTIKVAKAKSIIHGDTAVLSYDMNETETIFGQNLWARYHVIDTWLRRNGEWQIIASQAHRYYEDPTIGKIDPNKFAHYVGTYELAPGQIRTVSMEGNKLLIERNGKKEQLFPEACDIFFRKGIEGRILFRNDDSGKVEALIDRRNNEDVVWRKTK